jgi:hypothetical protein
MRKTLFVFTLLILAVVFTSVNTNAQTVISIGGSSCLSCLDFRVSGTALHATMSPKFLSSASASRELSSPEMTAFTLPEGRASVVNSSERQSLSAANRSGDFNLRLASSGTTMLGFLSVQSPSNSSANRTADAVLARDFESDRGGSCSVAGAHCATDSGFDRIRLILSSFDSPLARHHHHHHGFGPPGGVSLPPPSISTAPEPVSMLLFGTGLLVLGGTLRRRQQRTAS